MWKNTGRPKSGPIYTQYKKTNYYRYIKSVFMKSRSRLLRPVILPCMTYMNDNWICSKLLKQVTASPQQSANNLNKLVRSYGVVLRSAVWRRTCWESEVCAADERCRSSVHQHTASRCDHITPVLLQPRCVRLLKGLLQLRFEHDSSTIRARHATTRYEVFRALAYEIDSSTPRESVVGVSCMLIDSSMHTIFTFYLYRPTLHRVCEYARNCLYKRN